MNDLETKLQSTSEYEVLNVARILRVLLLDANNIAMLVNRERKVPISYHVMKYDPPELDTYLGWAILDQLDGDWSEPWQYLHGSRKYLHAAIKLDWSEPATPAFPMSSEGEKIGRDQFLKRPCVIYEKNIFSVRDIISHLANTAGAVHMGEPRKPREKALHQIMHWLYFTQGHLGPDAALPLGVYAVLAIGRVAFKALQPLYQEVAMHTVPEPAHYLITAGQP